MSNATLETASYPNTTLIVKVGEVEAHIAKVKSAWREHERAMTWEQK